MAKLSARLQQLRAMREQSHEAAVRPPAGGGRAAGKPWDGWRETAPYVWRKTTVLPFSRPKITVPGLFITRQEEMDRLLVYDFETTGLSGGAGTMIFLAGFARLKPGSIELEQIFLADYPGEKYFIREILSLFGPQMIYVSYNGKSFDRNILMNRCRINRMDCEMRNQLDLLYPARTLWRRVLDNCSLGQVEKDILDIHRQEDIPGALIPQCYQDFLRGIDEDCMRRVVSHHLQDIISLIHLLFYFEKAAGYPPMLTRPESRLGLAVLFLKKGDLRAVPILEDELSSGTEQAGIILAVHYKKNKDFVELQRVLNKMLLIRRSFFQSEEMAKLLEHRHKRPEDALQVMNDLLERGSPLTPRQKSAVCYRRKRLMGKVPDSGNDV